MKYIMCARLFPVYHPRAGKPTGFRESILNGTKIHTLRQTAGNRKTGDIVSLREWAGKPYGSKQVEFCQTRITIQQITLYESKLHSTDIAKFDGLSVQDFRMWFTGGKDVPIEFTGVQIWFNEIKVTA